MSTIIVFKMIALLEEHAAAIHDSVVSSNALQPSSQRDCLSVKATMWFKKKQGKIFPLSRDSYSRSTAVFPYMMQSSVITQTWS